LLKKRFFSKVFKVGLFQNWATTGLLLHAQGQLLVKFGDVTIQTGEFEPLTNFKLPVRIS